jgi:hypothetical protein
MDSKKRQPAKVGCLKATLATWVPMELAEEERQMMNFPYY